MAGADIEDQLDELLAKMTEAEKRGQLQQLDGLPDGTYRPEHPDLIRKGLLGSTLNVRGARRTNELPRIAVEEGHLNSGSFCFRCGSRLPHGLPDPPCGGMQLGP
jgi:hypothetical protein